MSLFRTKRRTKEKRAITIIMQLMQIKTSYLNRCGLRSAATLITTVASATLFCAAARAVDRQALSGHVPEAVARLKLQPLGPLPATNRLYLLIGLPLRNTNELARLVHDISDPASPRFRQVP